MPLVSLLAPLKALTLLAAAFAQFEHQPGPQVLCKAVSVAAIRLNTLVQVILRTVEILWLIALAHSRSCSRGVCLTDQRGRELELLVIAKSATKDIPNKSDQTADESKHELKSDHAPLVILDLPVLDPALCRDDSTGNVSGAGKHSCLLGAS